ncbi:hypothetical protein BE08_36420 [Sorangium cellulosum]|uniref:Uncharacterized protein n=1 Tax=Sorangium cellulosum TaxID=56 RepID=A0A150P6V8_SORCE|nr:hypothetical protein BE08_36420 [Sorangium cellulosum]
MEPVVAVTVMMAVTVVMAVMVAMVMVAMVMVAMAMAVLPPALTRRLGRDRGRHLLHQREILHGPGAGSSGELSAAERHCACSQSDDQLHTFHR